MIRRSLTPPRLFVAGFAGTILVGTALFWLPVSAQRQPLSLIDAFFTATSAVCVTGLTVIDPGTTLSEFGQAVLLCLIQLGGLGIMTFSVGLLAAVGLMPSFTSRLTIQQQLTHSPTKNLLDLARAVIVLTFVFELAGALILFFSFLPLDRFPSVGAAAWAAVFHAVSAFCNAGFSLFHNSLVDFRGDPVVILTMVGLIASGGLGFLVLIELGRRTRGRGVREPMSLHTRVTLSVSLVLWALGFLLFMALEWHDALARLPWHEKILSALFQTVTPRTAGFSTVDYASLSGPVLILTIGLMIIGASPGSTGGGLKTTTFAVLWAQVTGRLRGHERIHFGQRTLPPPTVNHAITVTFVYLSVVALGFFLLMIVQKAAPAAFLDYLFEA
ncbi:MAG: potassium transporter TrkH, partial [Proteobacteria bacterium]|nr:potassium transporter TrkH [Pseudomonadota bacterium]